MFTAFVRKHLWLAVCLFSLQVFSQQPFTPKTLLWRISGNGLQQPSYVYGTMHLQDKRLFRFGDSVYHAISSTEGLATEIDFQEAMDSIFHNQFNEAKKDRLLAREKVKLNRSKLDPSAQKLLRRQGITGTTLSKKDLKDIRERRMQDFLKEGEMPTVVDGFLLGLAQRQGKWTGGIEDVNDQLDLRDEIGGGLEPANVLAPDQDFRQGVEAMIQIYLAQDLDKLNEWSNRGYQGEARDAILIRRNIKMARRMDSLSARRAVFFAVGAAHLPGDSGVIALLRTRGFQVEPVFSAKQIPGDEYAAGLQQKTWLEVKGEDSVYTVQMPGQPTEMGQAGDPKMRLFFDLTTMSFYMAGHYYGHDEKVRSLDDAVRQGARNMGGRYKTEKIVSIEQNGLSGKEVIATKDGFTMRLRVFAKGQVLYLLMAGTAKKEMINGPDAGRFFASFRPGQTTLAKKPWKEFRLPEKAFAVQLPGTPEPQKEMNEKSAADPSMEYSNWHSTDPQTNLYYLVQVRQVRPGYTIQNDSSFLASLKEDYEQKMDTITRYEVTEYKGYPAIRMDYEASAVNGVYKTLHVLRGNRLYLLLGGAQKGSNMSDVDAFFQSLELLSYADANWQKTGGPGFATLAPAAFVLSPPDSTRTSKSFYSEYTATNPNDAVSYFVQKSVFAPHYWAESDSLLMEEKLTGFKGESDTLLQKTWIPNIGFRGLDVVIQPAGQTALKKIRLLVNKDTLYNLFALVHRRDWESGQHQRFFNDFRLQQEVPPTVYTNQAAQLLQAMTATDSADFAAAMETFESVNFGRKDLPLLHKALLENYRNSEDYSSANTSVLEKILPLADSSTLAFVKEAYAQQTDKKETNKYRLLQLLARMKTARSYEVLKPLLLAGLPKQGSAIPLQRPWLDSLQLAATLFPELLQKADDSLLAPVIALVAHHLLDSNLLAVAQLKDYKNTILRGAEQEFGLLEKGDYEPWELMRWAWLLQWLNEPEANRFLQKLLTQNNPALKQAAILALLKNGEAVPPAAINSVAADRGQRLYFYEAVQKAGKEAIFPALYGSQKSLAESELYNLFEEDYEDFTLTYIGQRIAPFEGRRQLFHLFKVKMDYEDDGVKRDYLCVAGPYPVAGTTKTIYGAATGLYTEERYQPQKTDRQLKAFLLSMEPAEK